MSTLTIEEVAKRLNGCEYGDEEIPELFDEMEAAGLVCVFGYSDDNAELRGAIHDEIGVYDGGEILLNEKGIPENKCDDDDCPYYKDTLKGCRVIEAVWCPDEPDCSWAYKTDIPHVTFDVVEDGELYCRGIVFRLADAKAESK